MQNKALILRKDRIYSTSLLYCDARLASWKTRALTAAMKMMFKFKYFSNDFIDRNDDNIEQRLTRVTAGPTFSLAYPNSTRYLKSTASTVRAEWNNLPSSFRKFEDFELFKLSIKRYYKKKWEAENIAAGQ